MIALESLIFHELAARMTVLNDLMDKLSLTSILSSSLQFWRVDF